MQTAYFGISRLISPPPSPFTSQITLGACEIRKTLNRIVYSPEAAAERGEQGVEQKERRVLLAKEFWKKTKGDKKMGRRRSTLASLQLEYNPHEKLPAKFNSLVGRQHTGENATMVLW